MLRFIKSNIIILVFACSSCTITQEFNFNEDFSGSAKFTFDISHLKKYLSSIDSTTISTIQLKDSIDWIFSQKAFQLYNVGLENIEIGSNDNLNKFYFSFHFDDIDELNKALIAPNNFTFFMTEWPTDTSLVYFTLNNDNTLSYHGISTDTNFGVTQEMEAMKAYFVFKTIFNLKDAVKKTNNNSYILSNAGKRVEYRNFILNILGSKNNTDVILQFGEK